MTIVFHYPGCTTCKKALKWLREQGVEAKLVDITLAPPSPAQLRKVLKLSGVPLAKLFNTSGQVYRQENYKEKLTTLTEKEALEALSGNGKLIKRPLVLGSDVALVGFQEAAWKDVLT